MTKAKAKYRLQVVLEKREREKDQAARDVNVAKKAVEFEEKKLEQIVKMRMQIDVEKEAVTARFHETLDHPPEGCDLGYESTAHDRYQGVLDEKARHHDQAIVQQKIAIEAAKARVKAAERALLQATINVQAMEKHKDEWRRQIKREELEKEQALQEELGEAMWLQKRRKNAR